MQQIFFRCVQIIEVKKMSDNIQKQSFKQIAKSEAKQKIAEIKKQSKKDISDIKFNLKIKLLEDNSKAIEKAERKREKRQENEILRNEYESKPKRYSIGEEIINSITHGIGTGLAIAALVLLLARVADKVAAGSRGFYYTSFAIFGSSMILLYLMSTLYHALTPYGAKKVFAIFDHSSIYLLIAGTYTPFCLTTLHGSAGWVLFGIIWGLAVLGVVFYAIFGNRMRVLSAITYVLMGWMIVFAYKRMSQTLPHESIVFLLLGGAAYTVGVVFYALKKIKWTHCIWHLFVIFGSILHFFSVYYSI